LDALAKVSRPVIVELLGHGRSPTPESAKPYHPENYIRAFEKIRKLLGTTRWLLCGQFMGAGLTLRYALDHLEHIMAHVFTNTNSGLKEIKDIDEVKKGSALLAQMLLDQGHEGIKKIPVHPANARWLPKGVKAALLADYSSLIVLGVANTVRYTSPELSVRSEISKNRVPTLLMCGKREKRFKARRDFAESHMPLLDIVDLNAGHAVNIDAADEFNQAVTAFFLKHTS